MHVISSKKLCGFLRSASRCKGPLEIWYHMLAERISLQPDSIKQKFRTADFPSRRPVVFNIKGNTYRIWVKIKYENKNYLHPVRGQACRIYEDKRGDHLMKPKILKSEQDYEEALKHLETLMDQPDSPAAGRYRSFP